MSNEPPRKPALSVVASHDAPKKPLTPAAQRALAEAEERRRRAAEEAMPRPKELQGPKGPEPTRYGDWENKGIISDF
ncbi:MULTISPECIES: DUF1674 domain-containing protein [Bradyrhizobium]|jgi:hypothetical protein|uniref:DUF1674 domain-containing protein n=1 Tax=Bradyrhizobium denitrificans TaxID=2734912 RepID=A0ABS5G0S8_9BRAD|nr:MULTISPECIES: DUF1674 domain-containing protein [Bradyrhizobium]RTM03631.1 MAG: DUF1674 domain-containing protein [Bradyrhizobiaceae bacterium]ABQ32618.1 hypothetical protein BBta_0326 [Bradyrhizobium sp. BTAi1]MBR1134879.1 DUF1674 domain-containing protein [Bradyrhizobium denitrificans]MCL8485629.1 DUF1674 domain-containing protein [Bradyrhizobium denitrificans]MDU1492327.1 DUF1674 domain-containing protein [Bradyrhizobium sp.]